MSRPLHAPAAAVLLFLFPPPATAQEEHDHDEHDPTHGGLVEAPEPEMAPEEVRELVAAVRSADGEVDGLRVEVERELLDDFPGLRARVRVVNDGSEPRTIDAVQVADETLVRPWIPPTGLSILSLEGARLDRCEVTPFRVRRESRRLLVVALPDRRSAFVAGFDAPGPGVETIVAAEPGLALTLKLSAEVRYGGRTLAPGEALVTPDLRVLFAPEAWVGLSPFLDDAPDTALDAASWSPVVPVSRPDGGVGLARNPRGRALDLLEGDGRGHVWRLDGDDGAPEVELTNPDGEPLLVTLRFADLSLPSTAACEVVGPDGSLGLYRGEVTRALSPESTLRLRVEARPEETSDGEPWQLVALAPPDVGLPIEVSRFAANDPRVAERLAHSFRYGGFVIANHRGADVLAPVPAALSAYMAPRVFPTHAAATRTPRGDEARFLERSSNVEWLLAVPRRAKGAKAWLVSPEAGWDAMPLEGTLADGRPAGRGFLVPASPGLVMLTLDLAPAEVDALVETLRSRETRADVQRNIGRAMRTLRGGTPGGLFDALPFERHAPIDLAPGNAFAAQQWSMQVTSDGKSVETRRTCDGRSVAEDVILITRPLVFALDVPTRANDRIAVVLRRRPSRTLDDWALTLDNAAIGGVRRGTPTAPGGWVDEIVTFGAAEIRGRARLALVLRPIGGALPLARIAFFRVSTPPGTPLRAIPVTTHGPVRTDLDADGHVLRVGGEAFLDGYGMRPGGGLEFDAEGRFVSLLARVGIDGDAGAAGSAVVRVMVDGREQLVTEVLRGGEAPLPITVPLIGVRSVRIEVLDAGDGADGDLVDLVDARLIPR